MSGLFYCRPLCIRQATRPGDKLLREDACGRCTSETGGLGAAATNLLLMIKAFQTKGAIEALISVGVFLSLYVAHR